MAWLRDWLRRGAPPGLEVRGLLCQSPARLRGLPVGELRGEMDACDPHHQASGRASMAAGPSGVSTATGPSLVVAAGPGGVSMATGPSLVVAGPGGVSMATGPSLMAASSPGLPPSSFTPGGLWVQAAPGGSLRVRWPPSPPGASLRLSWLRPGGGAVTETLVKGEKGEYVVGALQP
ncbi:FLRT1 protein, partial [Nycticryphes semicollaris]|nr:FLRT1 protein [Nycticryphes semicollaris]